jgi:exodeoxyribonuclease V alpha subunit
MSPAAATDLFDARMVSSLAGRDSLVGEFNRAGVLAAADVHVARRLGALAGEADEDVLLAVALAVRAPRVGHVYADLATVRETAAVETEEQVDLSELAWPDVPGWVDRVRSSPLVAGVDSGQVAPLRLLGSHLYLDRYYEEERQVASDLLGLAGSDPASVREDVLADGLARLFGEASGGRQALAAATALLRALAIIAGGPGTGKTTTVARIVALLWEQALATRMPGPLIALAAPTGKAAARLREAVQAAADQLPVAPPVREAMQALESTTIHRLLGWRPDSHSRFRYNRSQRLPHDVVIVDETSMVSLSQMARLAEAVRPDARLILVGDPDQLVSIEAGAVLGDIVGPARAGLLLGRQARAALEQVTGGVVAAGEPPAGARIGDGIVVLDRVHRFGGGIATLAAAIRHGDPDEVVAVLRSAPEGVEWIELQPPEAGGSDAGSAAELAPVREAAVRTAIAVAGAASAGDAERALGALSGFRLLCAHRRGPHGVATWNARIESWLGDAIEPADRWYVGRPLLVTENDYELGLYNGDAGVVVRGSAGPAAAFARGNEIVFHSPLRLGSVETVYAMTIHKSQGSQFQTAAVLLPERGSRLLTRELLYTAATRATKQLVLVGDEDAVRAAVARPVARASGLGALLWRPPSRP